MVVAGIFGIAYSMLLSYAAVNMKANQVISGTAMNMLVPAIILLFCKMTFNSDGVTTTIDLYIREVPLLSQIPLLGDLFFKNTYLTVYVGFIILIVSTITLYKTRFGLRLRACGEHPHAADSVGVNVGKMRYAGVALSGFLAGVGGYFYSVGILTSNISGHSGVAGYGFLALAVMIFGQWKPIRIMWGALFFALLSTLSTAVPLFPVLDNLGIDKAYYKMLPYLATLIVLIFTSKSSKAPKAEGIPYDKALR
jgi:simple sugar transport system permease protein